MAGHAAGDRMNRVLDGDAAVFEQLGQFAHGVLRLGGGESIAGNEDDAAGKGELHGGVVEIDLAHHAADVGGRLGNDGAESAEEDVGDGAVHRLAHQDGKNEAGEAVERAGDDEDVVAEDESGGGGGEAGVGIQQRHDDRHVRRADGNDQHNAEDEGDAQHGVEERWRRWDASRKTTKQATMAEEDGEVDDVLACETGWACPG